VIDTGPEFRLQTVAAAIPRLDAVFYTHSHADHLHGLDDVRPYCAAGPVPVYAAPQVITDIRRRFSYIFHNTQEGGGKPRLTLNAVTGPVHIGTLRITPVPILHGRLWIYGWRIDDDAGGAAWITDVSSIPERSMALLKGTRHLFLGALRARPHPTHFSFIEAFEVSRRLRVDTRLIHICHEHSHNDIVNLCRSYTDYHRITDWTISPAYDGLVVGQQPLS
jgi:phosphoribosyl 1,2-cyclic phosphate phosphodiesterase